VEIQRGREKRRRKRERLREKHIEQREKEIDGGWKLGKREM
jgi:hypothetical protein